MQSLTAIAVDPDKSRGVWFWIDAERHLFDESPHDEPHPEWISVKVARAGNPAYRDREADLWAMRQADVHAAGSDLAALEKINRDINRQLVGECLLVDWRNIDGMGEWTAKESAALIADPRYDKLAVFVWRCANRIAAFEAQHEDTVLGN